MLDQWRPRQIAVYWSKDRSLWMPKSKQPLAKLKSSRKWFWWHTKGYLWGAEFQWRRLRLTEGHAGMYEALTTRLPSLWTFPSCFQCFLPWQAALPRTAARLQIWYLGWRPPRKISPRPPRAASSDINVRSRGKCQLLFKKFAKPGFVTWKPSRRVAHVKTIKKCKGLYLVKFIVEISTHEGVPDLTCRACMIISVITCCHPRLKCPHS